MVSYIPGKWPAPLIESSPMTCCWKDFWIGYLFQVNSANLTIEDIFTLTHQCFLMAIVCIIICATFRIRGQVIVPQDTCLSSQLFKYAAVASNL